MSHAACDSTSAPMSQAWHLSSVQVHKRIALARNHTATYVSINRRRGLGLKGSGFAWVCSWVSTGGSEAEVQDSGNMAHVWR